MPPDALEIDSTTTLLLVEPSQGTRALIAAAVPDCRYEVIEARDGPSAWSSFQQRQPSVVMSAFDLPGLSGRELFARVRKRSCTPFLFHTTDPDMRVAVAAIQAGADDVLVLPDHASLIPDRLAALLAAADRDHGAGSALAAIVGRSPGMRRIRERLAGVVGLRIPVLLSGPRGSGASFVAETLARSDGCDLTVIPHGRPRAFQPRDAGRLMYLDRVDCFPIDLQAAWAHQIDRIELREADTARRVILSISTDLEMLSLQGKIEPRLVEQLDRFTFKIPSLRQRRGDISLLARDLLSRIGERLHREHVSITDGAVALLRMQPWPGNVAELERTLEQLVAFSSSGRISRREVQEIDRSGSFSVSSMRRIAEHEQREQLVEVLRRTGGNMAEAARELGMSRGAIIYRAQKHGLMAPRSRGAMGSD